MSNYKKCPRCNAELTAKVQEYPEGKVYSVECTACPYDFDGDVDLAFIKALNIKFEGGDDEK